MERVQSMQPKCSHPTPLLLTVSSSASCRSRTSLTLTSASQRHRRRRPFRRRSSPAHWSRRTPNWTTRTQRNVRQNRRKCHREMCRTAEWCRHFADASDDGRADSTGCDGWPTARLKKDCEREQMDHYSINNNIAKSPLPAQYAEWFTYRRTYRRTATSCRRTPGTPRPVSGTQSQSSGPRSRDRCWRCRWCAPDAIGGRCAARCCGRAGRPCRTDRRRGACALQTKERNTKGL